MSTFSIVEVDNDGFKVLDSGGTEIDPASESKLEAVRALLETIDIDTSALAAIDYATQATLAAADAKLATIDADTSILAAVDYATQTTLDALLTAFNAEDFASETTLAAADAKLATIDADTSVLAAVDYATQATLDSLLTAFNAEDFASETTLAAADTKLATIDAVLDAIYIRQNDRNQKTQLTNGTLDVSVSADASINRLEIQGKVQSVGAIPPPSTNPVVISADTPLTVGSNDTTFSIPTGETFHLQQITVGNEDPTKGALTTVIFDNGSEHVIERVYTAGFTVQVGFADIVQARDGTALLGAAGTTDIIVRREKFSGSNIEIDAEVRGYTS